MSTSAALPQRPPQRARVLAAAYARHPERFPHGLPQPPVVPTEVWINKPALTPGTSAASGTPGTDGQTYTAGMPVLAEAVQ